MTTEQLAGQLQSLEMALGKIIEAIEPLAKWYENYARNPHPMIALKDAKYHLNGDHDQGAPSLTESET